MNSTPLCFTELQGQSKARKLIIRSLRKDRLPHAFIFKGPAGVGKTLFARGLAAAINCKEHDVVGACGKCSSCKKFRSGSHPDFSVVCPDKGMIKIGQIRDLIKEVSYPPYESNRRVVVLEDVHTMRREAANALLKTLEEPPEDNVLILTADSAKNILATLTSRCQVIPFFSLLPAETISVLEQHGLGAEEAELYARLSEGSPGEALLLHKNEMVPLWRELTAFLRDKRVHPDRDVGLLLKLAEKMAACKDDLVSLLGLFRLWIRDMLLGVDQGTDCEISPEYLKNWSSAELFDKLHAVNQAEKELARNCNRGLVCEVLLFKLQG